jgi:hypothetical protein
MAIDPHFIPINNVVDMGNLSNITDQISQASKYIGRTRTDYQNAPLQSVSMKEMNANILTYNSILQNTGYREFIGDDPIFRRGPDGDFMDVIAGTGYTLQFIWYDVVSINPNIFPPYSNINYTALDNYPSYTTLLQCRTTDSNAIVVTKSDTSTITSSNNHYNYIAWGQSSGWWVNSDVFTASSITAIPSMDLTDAVNITVNFSTLAVWPDFPVPHRPYYEQHYEGQEVNVWFRLINSSGKIVRNWIKTLITTTNHNGVFPVSLNI